jgi:uncharacterized iron-regulated protein
MALGQLHASDGSRVALEVAAQRLAGVDVILFGELHGDAVVHEMERRMGAELLRLRGRDLVLGAEMFEADDQIVLDEYLSGLILHHHLTSEAKVWENYETDYRPLVELAKAGGIPFVATNVPRRYANLVAREGMEALERLGEEARRYLAPLPIRYDADVPGYPEMLGMRLPAMPGMKASPRNMVAAQAVKDATMAHFIATRRARGQLFLHFNGVFHSQRGGGIGWFLAKADPGVRVATMSTVAGDAPVVEQDPGARGDFVLVVTGA